MSGVALDFTLEQDAVPALERVAVKAMDARRMLENIGAFLDSDVTRRFIAGVEPDGTAWKPSERAQSEGGKTLVDTTALMKSTTHNVLGDDMVEHGVTEIYGAIHHFGGETGRNQATKIEARPIIGIAQRQEARIDKMVTGFMNSWFQ